MELQQLQHFLAAVECGTIRKAAEQQNITQSGLSRSIIALEEQVGVPLLSRGAGGVETTAFGQVFIEHAKAILNQKMRALDALTSLKQAKTGSVNLGITRNFAHYFVPDVLSNVVRTRPKLRLSVQSGPFQDLVERLRLGELDLVFGLIDASYQSPEIVVTHLFPTRSIIVAREGHPLLSHAEVSAQDLMRAQWAMLHGEGIQQAFASFFTARQCPVPDQVIRANSLALLKNMIAHLDLLTILPREYVSEDIQSGKLAQIDYDTPADRAQAGLIFRSGVAITPAMKFVADEFRRAASDAGHS